MGWRGEGGGEGATLYLDGGDSRVHFLTPKELDIKEGPLFWVNFKNSMELKLKLKLNFKKRVLYR